MNGSDGFGGGTGTLGGAGRIGDFDDVIAGKENPVYTPYMQREGSRAVFGVNVVGLADQCTLQVTVQHRNRGDVSWSTAATFSTTSADIITKAVEEIKEFVRLRMIVTTFLSPTCSARVRTFEPTWQA